MKQAEAEPVKCFEILEAKGVFRGQFEDFYMARSHWAEFLNCSRTTLWEYEQKIIRLVFPVMVQYRKADFLDGYQRFILALIYGHSQGWMDGKRRKYGEIKDWLKRSHEYISREQFEAWISKE